MTIIFCDIDGVLNSSANHKDGFSDVEEDKTLLLKELIEKLEAKLIITSKVRFNNIQELRINSIKNFGINVDDYFKGTFFSPTSKANECLGYLQFHFPNFDFDKDRLIILDDQDDGFTACDIFKDSFFLVDSKTGLTIDKVEEIYKNGVNDE